jgi:hypothetical protein
MAIDQEDYFALGVANWCIEREYAHLRKFSSPIFEMTRD